MLPVSPDVIAWITQELDGTLVEERDDGCAQVLAGDPSLDGMPFVDALTRILRGRGEGSALPEQDLVERVRAGAPLSLSPGDGVEGHLLGWRSEDGRARMMFTPLSAGVTEVARRAAAADMAAGVAHEIANSLTAIAGWTKMASAESPLPERTREALEVVERSARDALAAARGLLRRMRGNGGHSIVPGPAADTDLGGLVREVLATLAPELEHAHVVVDTELAPGVRARLSPAGLRLIVSNLVRNALEALEAGGRIRVGVKSRRDRVVLTVADDGPGMSRETLDLAFARYFTTKEEGTGLGLALVRDTVDAAGGRMEVQSRRGIGTRFEVTLPGSDRLSASPPVRTASSGVHPKPTLLDRTVLVVDDDEALRSMVKTALELQGARVSMASGYREALELAGRWDVGLIDLTLGDGRGDQLLAALRRGGHLDRAVLITGSTDPDLDPSGAPEAVLRKPFQLDELQRVLEAVLDGTAIEAEA